MTHQFRPNDRVTPAWSSGQGREGVVLSVSTRTDRKTGLTTQSVRVKWDVGPNQGNGTVRGDMLRLVASTDRETSLH